MRTLLWAFAALMLVAASSALAAPVVASGGGYEATIVTDPPIIAIGKSALRIELNHNGAPVEDAEVRALVRMPRMDMGEQEETARPVEGSPGVYTVPAVFAMAGDYVADIKVIRDGAETLITARMAIGMDTGEGATDRRALLYGILIFAGLALALYTIARMRRTGQGLSAGCLLSRQMILSVVVLGGATAVSVYAVRHWRRPGAMTPIEAQAMEMATPPPPGTAPVTLASVGRGTVEQTVTYTGQAVGWTEQEVVPRVSGWIVDMPVYVGTRVRKGELLARLDTSQIAPAVAERTAMLRASESSMAFAIAARRASEASARQAEASLRSDQAEVETAQAEARSLEAESEGARETLEASRLAVPAAKSALEAARAEHAYRSAELRRMIALHERKAVSDDELDQARAMAAAASAGVQESESRVGQAEAELRAAESALRGSQAKADAARRKVTVAQERVHAQQAMLEGARAALSGAHSQAAAARSSASAAAASLAGVETQEGYAVIRASSDGVITRRLVSPGTLATPGRPILLLSQERPVRLQAAVSEADLSRIGVGTPVRIRRSADASRSVSARLTSVAGAVDPSTRTGLAEAVWPNTDERFRPGEAVVMEITISASRDVLRVPSEAVTEIVPGGSEIEGRRRRHAVWLAEPLGNGTYSARRVTFTAGIAGRRFIEAVDGLEGDDLIVAEGGKDLREGDRIAPAPMAGDVYVCPMHPEVRQVGPGACPKCLMALEKETRKR